MGKFLSEDSHCSSERGSPEAKGIRRATSSRNMGMFSFDCSTCGDHEQLDWTDHVVVALKNVKTDEVVHVLGKYDCHGGVSIDLCEGAPGKYDAKGNMTVRPKSAAIASIQVYLSLIHISEPTRPY